MPFGGCNGEVETDAGEWVGGQVRAFEGGDWPEGGVVRADAGKIMDSVSRLDIHTGATTDDARSLEYLTQHRSCVVAYVIVHDLLR